MFLINRIQRLFFLQLITIVICLISNKANCQKWTFKEANNDFDGKYRIGNILGSGGEFPYLHPRLNVNYFFEDENLNIYVSNAPPAVCDNKEILIKFNSDENRYHFFASTNSESDVWFLNDGNLKEPTLTSLELLEAMKKHSFMGLRLRSNCGQIDYKFSLTGSAHAIDFVAQDYINFKKNEYQLEKEMEAKVEIALADKLKKREELIKSNAKLYALTNENCQVFKDPRILNLFVSLQKRERIVISNFNDNFYKIHSSVTVDFKGEIFYIKKDCIIMESIELINRNLD